MSFYPTIPSLQQAVEQVWYYRHLYEAQALDPLAAVVRLQTIWDGSTNPRLRRLIIGVLKAMFPNFRIDPAWVDEAAPPAPTAGSAA